MKILFLSDIHGITTNLSMISLLIKKENFDKVVVLGDLYDNGFGKREEAENGAVKNFLVEQGEKLLCLKGNCDSFYEVQRSPFPIHENVVKISPDGIDIYCTHGNLYPRGRIPNIRKGVIVYGHEHYPHIEKEGMTVLINTGSISLPRHHSKASFLCYENRKFTLFSVDGATIDTICL